MDNGDRRDDSPADPVTASPLAPVPMEPTAPPQRSGRAGRNLPAALAVAVALGAIILLSLYLWKVAFVGVVVIAVVLGLWELSNALASTRIVMPVVPVLIGAVVMLVAGYAGGPEPLLVALAITAVAVLVWRLPEAADGFVRDVTAGLFAALYVPFLAAFAVLLLRPDDGADRVVVFIVLVVLSDVGGYAAGVLFGRHPMAPSVSPKKSWEGLAGSALFAAVGGAIIVSTLVEGSPAEGAGVGLAVMLAATLGDLGESLIKRDLGIKDMGALLPGHGGMMDRLDSLLPAAPVAYLLLAWLVPVS